MDEKDNEKSESPVKFVFIGDPLLDISAKCDLQTLQKYGLKSDDCIRGTKEHDDLFQTLFEDPRCRLTAGGSAQNTARITEWILGSMAHVTYVGAVGKDEYSTWMTNKLSSEGVEALYMHNENESTGVCACLLVSGGERSMVARQGASATFSVKDLENQQVQDRLRSANCIYMEGYFLAHSPDVALKIADLCQPHQIFSINLAAEYVCNHHADTLLRLLPRVDILVGNEAEVRVFAKALGVSDENIDLEHICCLLADVHRPTSRSRIVVVSRGSQPVIVAESGKNPSIFKIPEGIPVVDSVGCGDALGGGFLGVYAQTKDLDLATRVGIRAASAIVQRPGSDPPPYEIYNPKIRAIKD